MADDRDYAIRTILAEAGGEGPEGMAAVANVIRNRAARGSYGASIADVVTAKHQFEPWAHAGAGKDNDPLRFSPSEERYQAAGRIWDAVQSGKFPDPTDGATHFFAPKMQADLGRSVPDWAKKLRQTASLGGHVFFTDGETPKGTKMFEDQSGGTQTAMNASPPAAPRAPAAPPIGMGPQQFQQFAQGGHPRPHAGLLGNLLFGPGGLQGVMQKHLPHGIFGSILGMGEPAGGGNAMTPPGALPPQQPPQAGPPMSLPGAMPPAGTGAPTITPQSFASMFPGFNPLAALGKGIQGLAQAPQAPAPSQQQAGSPTQPTAPAAQPGQQQAYNGIQELMRFFQQGGGAA